MPREIGCTLIKVFFLPLLIALALVQTMLAQTSTFDIATFVPPKGWSQAESNGVLVLQDRKRRQGRVEFCQIYIFPSQPSNATPTANFQLEWEARVARTFGVTGRPSPQTQTTPDGWTALIAFADFVWQGVPTRAILVTTAGFGRLISVLVTVSPKSYQTELDNFFKDLNFHANPGGQNPLGPTPPAAGPDAAGRQNPRPGSSAGGSLASYMYTIPDGWARQELPDRITLISPQYSAGDRCQLTLLPMRPSSLPLDQDAIGKFREIFNTDPMTNYPSSWPKMAKGTSAQGWEYFMMRKLVGGQEGEARTTGVTLMVAKLGDQVATIVGTSKDFLWSSCFGELHGDAWPKFFYGLQFKNVAPSGHEPAAIRQRLAGSWSMASGSVGLAYTFQANGRYASTGATQYRSRVSDTTVLQTTQGFAFGNGAYSIDGNMLVMKRDDNKRFTCFFRLEQVNKDGGRTWADTLCLLDPGSPGEVCYRRE